MDEKRKSGYLEGRYCTLEYRTWVRGNDESPGSSRVVMCVLQAPGGSLSCLAVPNLMQIVRGEDLLYINDLLFSIPDRGRRYPAALFEELSSLSAGSFVANKVGVSSVDDAYLNEICAEFVDISELHSPEKDLRE